MSPKHLAALALFALVPSLALAGPGKTPKDTKAAKSAPAAIAASASGKDAAGKKAGAPQSAAPAAPRQPAAATRASTYEQARAGATPAGDLGQLVEPLFASCPSRDDLARRQCELIRQWHLARLKERTWYAMADPVALQQQPYDSVSKSVTLAVNGCLQCTRPPVVAGAPRLIATRAPKAIEEGAPVGLDLGFHEMPFDSSDKAAFWTEKVRPRLRVEFVFAVGQPFDAKTVKGVAINMVGHRVYNMCTGEVLASQPPSKDKVRIGVRDPSCPAADAPTDEEIELAKAEASLPDSISRTDVQKAMAPVQQRIYECGEEFELKQGVARVHVTLPGNGKAKMTIAPPYDKGDVHLCIRSAINDAKFPKFKSGSPPVEIDYPFVLRR